MSWIVPFLIGVAVGSVIGVLLAALVMADQDRRA